MRNSKNENRKRSRAITAIIKDIGRKAWNKIPKKDKSVLIKEHISKTQKKFKEERQNIKAMNKNFKSKYIA
ncbi:hypothetical protein ACFLY2_01035 [Patescibacteria group bacterium]